MSAMDRLEAMKTFVRVVERGSFSAVAKELGATQSAVSKQVAALEARLGAKLLVRSTRAIALTRAGEAFFPEARRLAEEVEAAEAKARANERTLEGVLKVAASVGFGAGRLMPVVRSFLAAHPGLAIELKLDDAFVDIIAEGVDVAIRIGELAESRLVATKLGETRRLLVASPDYLRYAKPLTRISPRTPAFSIRSGTRSGVGHLMDPEERALRSTSPAISGRTARRPCARRFFRGSASALRPNCWSAMISGAARSSSRSPLGAV